MRMYLEAGKIINTHGIKGDVKIESWCDSPASLAKIKIMYLKNKDETYREIKINHTSVYKDTVIAHIEGIDDINDALAYKNKIIYANRNDIPLKEGDHFIADLIGLPIIDIDSGIVLGKLLDVSTAGVHDIYEVELSGGAVAYMPAVDEFVKKIDLENGIYIRPIEGLLQ